MNANSHCITQRLQGYIYYFIFTGVAPVLPDICQDTVYHSLNVNQKFTVDSTPFSRPASDALAGGKQTTYFQSDASYPLTWDMDFGVMITIKMTQTDLRLKNLKFNVAYASSVKLEMYYREDDVPLMTEVSLGCMCSCCMYLRI